MTGETITYVEPRSSVYAAAAGLAAAKAISELPTGDHPPDPATTDAVQAAVLPFFHIYGHTIVLNSGLVGAAHGIGARCGVRSGQS